MNELLNVPKAEKLLVTYKRKQPAKAKFLKELITWQNFFGEYSIVEVKINLNLKYQKRTINTVLAELGYTDITIKNTKHYYLYGGLSYISTEVVFS